MLSKHLLDIPEGEDCIRCGLCCVAAKPRRLGFVELAVEDLSRLSNDIRDRYLIHNEKNCWATKMVEFVQSGEGPLPGLRTLACSALRGTLGNQCSCSFYDVRPIVCSRWPMGSKACLAIRKRFVLSANTEDYIGAIR